MSTEQIRSALLALIAHPVPQDAGGHLTDGLGASRLAVAMLGPQAAISLRPAVAADQALLLRWANDHQVRARSFSPDLISSSAHQNWLLKGLATQTVFCLLQRRRMAVRLARSCLIGSRSPPSVAPLKPAWICRWIAAPKGLG